MSDPTTPDPAPEAPAPQSPEERIAALEAEVADLRDKWLAEAELDNLRKRTAREVAEARAFAIQRFAADVVEAADNCAAAWRPCRPRAGRAEVIARLRGGFESVEKSFLAILSATACSGTTPPASLRPGDAPGHGRTAPPRRAPRTVLTAWTPAWTLNGRLLKPAMVVVAAEATAAAEKAGEQAGWRGGDGRLARPLDRSARVPTPRSAEGGRRGAGARGGGCPPQQERRRMSKSHQHRPRHHQLLRRHHGRRRGER